MPKRFIGKLAANKALLWQIAMWLALLACAALLTLLWFSGYSGTKDAIDSGRTLIISLESGEISGKITSTEPPKTEEEKPKADEAKPEEPRTEEKKPDEAKVEEVKTEEPKTEENKPEAPKAEEPVKAPEPTEKPAAEPKAEAPAPAPVKEAKIEPGEELPMTQKPEEVAVVEESVTIVPSQTPLPDINDKLIEKAKVGILPAIGPDGVKPWQYYSKPFDRKNKQPLIAVIITGLGQSKFVTEKAMVMSENFTFSFSPYAKNVADWARTARLTAHERMLDLPMQASNYPAVDPGPYGLILDKGLQENELRLQWLMSRFVGHVGFISPHDEIYTDNEEAMKVLLQSLANRGLMLVMGHDPAKSEIKDILEKSSTPNVTADILIDEELNENSIDTRLTALEDLASKRGYAVGITQATPMTLERLRVWSDSLDGKGIVLVPVSAVAKLRFS